MVVKGGNEVGGGCGENETEGETHRGKVRVTDLNMTTTVARLKRQINRDTEQLYPMKIDERGAGAYFRK